MKILGHSEYLLYLYAQENYDRLVYDQRVQLHNAYQDISPTIVSVNYETGLTCTLTSRVDEYAIYLAELRQKLKSSREKAYLKVRLYLEALNSLSPEEKEKITEHKQGVNKHQQAEQQLAILKLRTRLEQLITIHDLHQKALEKEEQEKRIASIKKALQQLPKETPQENKTGYLIDGKMLYLTEKQYSLYKENPNISSYDLAGS